MGSVSLCTASPENPAFPESPVWGRLDGDELHRANPPQGRKFPSTEEIPQFSENYPKAKSQEEQKQERLEGLKKSLQTLNKSSSQRPSHVPQSIKASPTPSLYDNAVFLLSPDKQAYAIVPSQAVLFDGGASFLTKNKEEVESLTLSTFAQISSKLETNLIALSGEITTQQNGAPVVRISKKELAALSKPGALILAVNPQTHTPTSLYEIK